MWENVSYCEYPVKGVCVFLAQSSLTLCDPMDCSSLGSFVHGILQARILEWVAIPFSRGSSQPRDWTRVSCIVDRHFTVWATNQFYKFKPYFLGFPGGSDGKASAYNAGDPGSIPGSGRSPGKGNGNPHSILAWRIPWTEEPGGLQSRGCKELNTTEGTHILI